MPSEKQPPRGASKPSEDAAGHSFSSLVSVMKRLLAPDGCPWDREQTLESLRPYLIEEASEVLDAIELGSAEDHCEELGDLLMQIVFQSELQAAAGAFTIDDVIASIREKLVRRHPHVFAAGRAENAEEVLRQWDAIKDQEKAARGAKPRGALTGVPSSLPGLARAQALSKKAAKVGFDWPDVAGARAKISEELGELDRAIELEEPARVAEELGDLLFATVSLARKLECDSETALRDTTAKFVRRFEWIERELDAADRRPEHADADELDALWNRAKRELA